MLGNDVIMVFWGGLTLTFIKFDPDNQEIETWRRDIFSFTKFEIFKF